MFIFFFQAEDGIRDGHVTGVQTCALPISENTGRKSAAGARSSKMAGWKKCSQSHYRPRTDDQFCCQIKVKIMYYQSFRLRSEERRVGKECRYRRTRESRKTKVKRKGRRKQ